MKAQKKEGKVTCIAQPQILQKLKNRLTVAQNFGVHCNKEGNLSDQPKLL